MLNFHIGDLADYRTFETFTSEIAAWQRLMRVEPEVVAHDLHPDYLSTKFAEKFAGVVKVGVQHHHAHIASVMAEHNLHEPILGVALDGTGYGTDGMRPVRAREVVGQHQKRPVTHQGFVTVVRS